MNMEQWEYQIFELAADDPVDDEAALNELGAKGWELVTINHRQNYAYFKRRKPIVRGQMTLEHNYGD